MSELQAIVLGLVQGLSEFLPISSSGHLILVPLVTGWTDQGLTFDVAVHIGSLGAVLLYFRKDLFDMIKGAGDWSEPGLLANPGRRLIALILMGTIPIIFGGVLIKMLIGTENLRNAWVVGCTSIFFGSALYIADRIGARERGINQMGFSDALIIGCAQVLALIPGTSRSGVTMTAARLLGLQRAEAARFSFLLSIPAILAAGLAGNTRSHERRWRTPRFNRHPRPHRRLPERLGRDRVPDAVAEDQELHALRHLPADPRRRVADLRFHVKLMRQKMLA